MGIMKLAVRAAEDVAAAATATAGAATGATVGAVVGATGGALRGAGAGIAAGARSEPAAVLGLAAVGAAGLVEWPIVLAVGGTALALRELRRAQLPPLAQRSTPRPAGAPAGPTGAPRRQTSGRPTGRKRATTQPVA